MQYRNEINFWNGKCSTLKRDLEYQERYLLKYKEDNGRLLNENDYLKVKFENSEREIHLLKKQVNGLSEDNDRINRMYQVVEKEAFCDKKPMAEKYVPVQENVSTLKTDGKQGKWKTVEDDYGTGHFATDYKKEDIKEPTRITMKRGE